MITKETNGAPKLVQSCFVDYALMLEARLFTGKWIRLESDIVESGGKFDDAYYTDVETWIGKHFQPEWLH